MAENPKLESSDILSLSREACELDEMGSQKISVSDQTNSLQFTNIKSDSFMVDVESLSPLTNKDITANSRIKLQRNFSRKGSQQRGSEKKINSSNANEKETNIVSSASASPRAAKARASMPEKPMVVTVGTTDHPMNPQVHHQITIVTANIGTTTAESRWMTGRFGFRRSPPSWTVNPRRILFFFATLSSMGTILLIYFTLSMSKHSGDDSALNL